MALSNPGTGSRRVLNSTLKGTQAEGETFASSELGPVAILFAPVPELFRFGEGGKKLDDKHQFYLQCIQY